MNFAFSALLILLLAIPGFAFIFAYRSGLGRPRGSRPFADDMPLAVSVVVLIHAGCAYLFDAVGPFFFGIRAYPEAALMLLTNVYDKDSADFTAVTGAIFDGWHPAILAAYFVITCVVGAVTGTLLRWLVYWLRLDRWLPFLKANDWYYLLHGENADGTPIEKADAARVTAVVGDYIYWGILIDYYVSSAGVLDSVVLTLPRRRKIGSGEQQGQFPTFESLAMVHEIDVDFLVLKYSECKNFGVLFDVDLIESDAANQGEPTMVNGKDADHVDEPSL